MASTDETSEPDREIGVGGVEGRPLTKENAEQPNPCRTQGRPPGRGERAKRVGSSAGGSKERREGTVHRPAAGCNRGPTAGQLPSPEEASCARDRRGDVDRVWTRSGRAADRSSRPVHQGAIRRNHRDESTSQKTDGRQRPLGIAALEDKVVQHAMERVLNQIWESFSGSRNEA
jgi:RNA-directed DNA polymerase